VRHRSVSGIGRPFFSTLLRGPEAIKPLFQALVSEFAKPGVLKVKTPAGATAGYILLYSNP
jgi:hypothetical protein